ncbi:MAG: N-acetylmuramoyl-L-alanine amidase [Clostridia bacterium]|nr:N-acetylmuramoyl-L-alanine amidase [Clostridia bacterium]
MYKIALNAGHYMNTPGKRCLKSIDPKETREWYLNDRICDKVENKLKAYTGYSLLRIDDTTGKTNVTLNNRAAKANNFKADVYISVHHNAGINGGSGGGVMAYTYLKVSDKTKQIQKLLYNKIIEKTGLKGNRATPITSANLAECRLTSMPAVLLECGFMDSTVDTPIILTDAFAEKTAAAICEALVQLGGLKLKETKAPADNGKLYYVQVGAYKEKANAEKMVQNLKKAGFDAVIK